MDEHHKIQPLDTEGIHRQEAGQHTQDDRTDQIATDQQEFFGNPIDDHTDERAEQNGR